MFKAVTGTDLHQYDSETQDLYKKRENDPRLTYVLSTVPRRARHNMPVLTSDDNNEYLLKLQNQRDNFNWKLMVTSGVFTFCCFRFTKAFYPYGIIARRSVPTTPMRQASYYGPMLGFFAYLWWCCKEYPRTQRSDLTCDSEL